MENKGKNGGVLATAQKREECERKARGIVELFSERRVNPELFLKSLVYLNPSYFDDIAEERALEKLCGYALCGKRITKTKKRYSICNKAKKVYDLDEYGNFCSIFCFNANNHIMSQILDSPLWLRDLEEVPKFNLLCKKKSSSAAGIDIKSKKKPEKNIEFVPVSTFAKLCLDDCGDIDISATTMNEHEQEVISTKRSSGKKSNETKLSTVMENAEESNNINDKPTQNESKSEGQVLESKEKTKSLNNNETSQTRCEDSENDKNTKNNCNEVGKKLFGGKSDLVKVQSRKEKKVPVLKDLKSITDRIKSKNRRPVVQIIDPLPSKVKTSESIDEKTLIEVEFSSQDPVVVENSLRNILRQWISLETLLFIHGEDKVKQILDHDKLSEHFEKLNICQLEIDQRKKYISICRRLCEEEIFEDKFESLLIKNNLKPLPDYKVLKKETKEFNSKVKAFYDGELYESADKNFGVEETENDEQEPYFLPSTDGTPQRHKFLLDALNMGIELLLNYIKYDSSFIITEINKLIKTFEVDPEDINFTPVIRNYLGLICLRILSLKDSELREQLEKAEFVELENSVFEQFPGKKDVLTNSLRLINEVDSFVETCVKSTDS